MDKMLLQTTITNLKKNNFSVQYFENRATLIEKILSDLKNAKLISRGGSVTIDALGLIDRIKALQLPFLDYAAPEDRLKSITAEYYLCGTNAISSEGQLINIDGAGNRVAAMTFGPKKVFIIAGTNKIIKDVHAGIDRIKNISAPMNAKRLGKNTPCVETGKCIDCNSPDRICRTMSIIMKPVKDRITIYLLDEKVGY